jgi:hypothetical protein
MAILLEIEKKVIELENSYNSGNYKAVIQQGLELLKSGKLKTETDYEIRELLSYSYLALDDLEKGWDLWIFRHTARILIPFMSKISTIPLWLGEKIKGNLLIVAEEGLGDEIFNSSFFHLLTDYADNVFIGCDLRLKSIYEQTFPEFTFFDRSKPQELIKHGKKCKCYGLLSDLPRYLCPTLQNINSRKLRFLKKGKVADEIKKIRDNHRLIGVSYFTAGGSNADLRNFPDIFWKDKIMMNHDTFDFFNLQENESTHIDKRGSLFYYKKLKQLNCVDLWNDIEGLAELINGMDYISSIGNMIAHLAARLEKPVDVYLPVFKNIRWAMIARRRIYKTASIFEIKL